MPLPGATSLSATPARRRLAVKAHPARAWLGTGQIPAAGGLAARLHASPLSGTDLAQAARSNILPNIVLEIRSTDFVDCLVRLQAEAAGDDFFLDLGGAAEDRLSAERSQGRYQASLRLAGVRSTDRVFPCNLRPIINKASSRITEILY